MDVEGKEEAGEWEKGWEQKNDQAREERLVRSRASIRSWDCSSAGKAVRYRFDAISRIQKGLRQLAISKKRKSE